jgi:hypothetical protein
MIKSGMKWLGHETLVREATNTYTKFLFRKNHLAHPIIGERIILKWILAKQVVRTHDRVQGQTFVVMVVVVMRKQKEKNWVPLELGIY